MRKNVLSRLPVRLAINGFGRIGRTAMKIALEKRGIEVVAVNDLADAPTLAHLLRYDTVYGQYNEDVRVGHEALVVNGNKIRVFAQKDPAQLPWRRLKIDVVLECTGRFTDRQSAAAHLTAGAKQVIISAPPKGSGVETVVLGVNEKADRQDDRIISNASCTTNCIAPLIKIVNDRLGVSKATMTTIHSYTADQNLQDAPHRDLRRARAAAENIVPTTTGAAISTTEIIPSLRKRFDGLSIRVPTPVVSLSDLTMLVRRSTTIDQVNKIFRLAAQSVAYQGIVAVTDQPLVSSDFIKNPASAIVDLALTNVISGDLVKIIAWYDNEWGYSNRLVELAIRGRRLTNDRKGVRS